MKRSHDIAFLVVGLIAIGGIIGASYFGLESREQQAEIANLNTERAATLQQRNDLEAKLAVASTTINELESQLEDIREDLEDLADDYRDERNRNEEFEDQIRSLSSTLGDLDKLARTDEELLAKYSRVYFLNENYRPERLTQIDDRWVAEGKGDEYFHADAYDHLKDLLRAADRAGVDLKVVSAYRSFDEQTELKGRYLQTYGTGANAFSADQGYSEHQLGTTVDFSTPSIGNALVENFDQTDEFKWLKENAHKYGFVMSYPEGNTFYLYEPWHWRFVSTALARDLERRNETFYEMEQRRINEYLLNFFD